MASKKQLEEFVHEIALYGRAVEAAKARILLGIRPDPFKPDMVDSIVAQNHWADRNDDTYDLKAEIEALVLEYGELPVRYIIDTIKAGIPEHWDDMVSNLSYIEHPETLEERRLVLETLLLDTESPRTAWRSVMGLSHMCDLRSIAALEAFAAKRLAMGKAVDSSVQQTIDHIKKYAK